MLLIRIYITSLSFQIKQTIHSYTSSYFKIWTWIHVLKNSVGEVKDQGFIVGLTSYRLTSFSMSHCQSHLPFLKCIYFKIWPWKFQGHGHGWGQSSRSHCGSNFLSTHIPFISCQSDQYLTLKIQGQDHNSSLHSGSNILSMHIPFIPCQSILTFLKIPVLHQYVYTGKMTQLYWNRPLVV